MRKICAQPIPPALHHLRRIARHTPFANIWGHTTEYGSSYVELRFVSCCSYGFARAPLHRSTSFVDRPHHTIPRSVRVGANGMGHLLPSSRLSSSPWRASTETASPCPPARRRIAQSSGQQTGPVRPIHTDPPSPSYNS